MLALEGVRVIDLSRMIAAPYCTQILADLGAEVIRVEEAAFGAIVREELTPPGAPVRFSPYWLANNRNKMSITLNLRQAEAIEVLADLVKVSDVVVENFAPRSRAKLGLHEEWGKAINPELIWASLSAYGRTGPDRDRGGQDILAQARSGLLSITGDPSGPPMKSGNSSSDYLGGLHLAIGILAALHQRSTSGRGQLVDVGLLDATVACLDGYPLWSSMAGIIPTRRGNLHLSGLPYYSVYPCRDGYIAITGSGTSREKMFDLLGRPDLLPPAPPQPEEEHAKWCDEVVAAFAHWTSGQTFDEIKEALDPIGAGYEPVRTMDYIWRDPQLIARGMIMEYSAGENGVGGDNNDHQTTIVGNPIHLEDSPVTVRRPPPGVGQHNHHVLSEVLGYSAETISRLESGDAIWG